MGFPFDPVGAGLVYNVLDYGADPTGTNDSTTALQAALNAVAATGGTLFTPRGTYLSNGLTLTLGGKRIAWVGAGQGAKIKCTATTASDSTGGIYVTGGGAIAADWISIRDLEFEGNSTCGYGVALYDCYQGELANLYVHDFTTGGGWGIGIVLNESIDCIVYNPVVSNCAYSNLSIGNSANANTIIGGWLVNAPSGSFGARVNSNGNIFVGTIVQNCDGGIEFGGATANRFTGWLEGNPTYQIYDSGTDNWVSGYSVPSGTGESPFYYTGATRPRLDRVVFYATSAPVINIETGTTGLVISDCSGIAAADITNSSGNPFVVRNCTPLNPAGSTVPGTAFALPASGTAWTNNTGVDGTLYVTAAGTVTDVVLHGVTVGSSLSVGQSFFVPAGGTITLTYTTAPTLVFVGN